MKTKAIIQLEHISKSFDGQMILDDLCLDIHENEFVTLLGPSGCGKTNACMNRSGWRTSAWLTARVKVILTRRRG